jgi:putative tributyrin esterase
MSLQRGPRRRALARGLAVTLAWALSGLRALAQSPPPPPPAPDLPSLATRTFNSASLGKDRAYTVLLPVGYDPGGPRRYPVLYLLHGKSGDHTDWSKRAPLREAVGQAPLIVVMPDGDDGWYVDWADGAHRYEAQIVRDLVPHVDGAYRTLAAREGRAVAGLSMGGYGAVKIALAHPELFVSAASVSGALRFPREGWDDGPKVFGTGPPSDRLRVQNDVLELAFALQRTRPGWSGPALYLDCGTDDLLYDSNARVRSFLREIGVPYAYHEEPGGHSWEYWSARLPDLLRFSLAHLAKPAP